MTTALIFARMDSHRLPGKALMDIAGMPMLDRVVDRVRRAQTIGDMIIATSERDIDDPLAERAHALGVEVFRGLADDVTGRALACCTERGLQAFVRISGDSPFIAHEAIDGVCALFDAEQPDQATNVYPRSFPAGCSAEVIRVGALASAAPKMDAADREHVTTYFYRNGNAFRIANLVSGVAYGNIRLTVDTREELSQARWIMAQAGPAPETLALDDVVALANGFQATVQKAGQ